DDPSAQPIHEVEDISRLAVDTSTRGTQWGTGGMATKLTAGRIATAAGCTMVICNSSAPEAVVAVLEGQAAPALLYWAPRTDRNSWTLL
ncbi:PUA domain-containing protein, partial [Haematococcus lacustris]